MKDRWHLPPQSAALAEKLLRADMEFEKACRVRADLHASSPEARIADLQVDKAAARFHRLADQIGDHTDPLARIVLLAVIAYANADKTFDDDGKMKALEDGDCFEKPAAKLIEAVLEFAGISGADSAVRDDRETTLLLPSAGKSP